MQPQPSVLLRPLLAAAAAGVLLGASPGARAGGVPEPDLVWYGTVVRHDAGPPVRLTAGTLVWTLKVAGAPARTVTLALTNLHDQFSYVLRLRCEAPMSGAPLSNDALPMVEPAVAVDRATVTLNGQPVSLAAAPGSFVLSPDRRGRVERVDLVFAGSLADSDGDGLPDVWEEQYFPGGNAHPDADPDGDGLTNLEEYLAGTDPTDPNSLFAIVSVARGPAGFTVRWSSAGGRHYRVLRAAELGADGAGFAVVGSGLEATPPWNSYLDVTANPAGTYFYRIQLDP